MSYTPDLFAPSDTETVLGVHQRAFDAWRSAAVAADRLQRESTLQVYEDMWSAFTAWCVGQSPQVTLPTLTEEDLARFLASREATNHGALSARHAWRLLSLIDRVLVRYAADHGTSKNEAASEYIRRTDAIRRANIGDRPAMEYLDAEQARRLVTYLSNVRPCAVDRRQLTGWQELRNLTAVALHLGAGVTPGDLRELPLDATVVAGGRWKDVPWKLKVPGNGNRAPRETPIAPWAGQLLSYWLTVRAEAGLPDTPRPHVKGSQGPFLFPGRSGQQWGKMAHYDAVKTVMEAAGVDDPGAGSGGAFRLRHTFALRQLRKKKSIPDVARWMGIANLEEMERYREVLDSYEEAV
jgi:site-specific recombinase XerD